MKPQIPCSECFPLVLNLRGDAFHARKIARALWEQMTPEQQAQARQNVFAPWWLTVQAGWGELP